MDRSINTERVYAGRIAMYLSYCSERRLDWQSPSIETLAAFLKWLVREPLPKRGPRATIPRFRSKGTANAVMTSVCEFLRFGAVREWVSPAVVERLAEPKFLTFLHPPGALTDDLVDHRRRTRNQDRNTAAIADNGVQGLR
jgi:hypothetical protein